MKRRGSKNSRTTRTITYYAFALNERGEIGQLVVVRKNGKQMRQDWTGVIYETERAAMADLARLNGCGEGS